MPPAKHNIIYTTIGELSSKVDVSRRAVAFRQRSWRRFLCAYMLPIRDLCATSFCVLLFFVFYEKKNKNKKNVAFRHRRDVHAARLMALIIDQ